jgi:hypothetical protein
MTHVTTPYQGLSGAGGERRWDTGNEDVPSPGQLVTHHIHDSIVLQCYYFMVNTRFCKSFRSFGGLTKTLLFKWSQREKIHGVSWVISAATPLHGPRAATRFTNSSLKRSCSLAQQWDDGRCASSAGAPSWNHQLRRNTQDWRVELILDNLTFNFNFLLSLGN